MNIIVFLQLLFDYIFLLFRLSGCMNLIKYVVLNNVRTTWCFRNKSHKLLDFQNSIFMYRSKTVYDMVYECIMYIHIQSNVASFTNCYLNWLYLIEWEAVEFLHLNSSQMFLFLLKSTICDYKL